MKKICLFILLLLLVGCSKNNEKNYDNEVRETIETYLKAYINKDSSGVCENVLPELIENAFDDIEGCKQAYDDAINSVLSEDGDYKYKIESIELLNEEDVDDLLGVLKRDFDVNGDTLSDFYKVIAYINDNQFEFYMGVWNGQVYVLIS